VLHKIWIIAILAQQFFASEEGLLLHGVSYLVNLEKEG
jgi:hypothetical protein